MPTAVGRCKLVEQILGQAPNFEIESTRMVWGLLVELSDNSRAYSWPVIARALAGSRNARFRRILAKTQKAALVMAIYDAGA